MKKDTELTLIVEKKDAVIVRDLLSIFSNLRQTEEENNAYRNFIKEINKEIELNNIDTIEE